MSMLAWRNLIHDKVRLGMTVTGIVFAVVLIVVEIGLFIGFTTTTSGLIDRSGADLWITAKRVPYIEQGVPFSERKLSKVLATPGVAEAQKYVARFSPWKRPDGRQENVQVVGSSLASGLGAPWNVVSGTAEDLKAPEAIFVDEVYRDKLGVTHVGQVVEIRGRRARVAGFTRGIRSFTTAPYVFTSFKNAQDYTSLPEDQTMYILVKAAAGVPLAALRGALAARVQDVDIVTNADFSRMTRVYCRDAAGGVKQDQRRYVAQLLDDTRNHEQAEPGRIGPDQKERDLPRDRDGDKSVEELRVLHWGWVLAAGDVDKAIQRQQDREPPDAGADEHEPGELHDVSHLLGKDPVHDGRCRVIPINRR